MDVDKQALFKVLHDYAVPDPKIVGKLPKGGIQLDFVGHADITRILIEIDPCWRWVPIDWDNGRPKIHVENGIATMWGELTLLGQARLGVGSCRADKQDLDKELVSDFLRNAAMRFGIALSLWSKEEWGDQPAKPVKKAAAKKAPQSPEKPLEAPESDANLGDTLISPELHGKFTAACMDKKIDPVTVAKRAGVDYTQVTVNDMDKLRATFKEMTSK